MTDIDLDAIEMVAREQKPAAWWFRVKSHGEWGPVGAMADADPASIPLPARMEAVESGPLFHDQSSTILALCARIRELEAKPGTDRPTHERTLPARPQGGKVNG